MIRVSISLDTVLTAREATGEYDRTREPPSDEEALDIVKTALRLKGPIRFLQDYGLADSIDIELGIE